MSVDPHADVSLVFPPAWAPLRPQRQLHHHAVLFISVLGHVVPQFVHVPVVETAVHHHGPRLRKAARAGKLRTQVSAGWFWVVSRCTQTTLFSPLLSEGGKGGGQAWGIQATGTRKGEWEDGAGQQLFPSPFSCLQDAAQSGRERGCLWKSSFGLRLLDLYLEAEKIREEGRGKPQGGVYEARPNWREELRLKFWVVII